MGGCASSPASRGDDQGSPNMAVLSESPAYSRKLTSSPENGKRSTADTIATAFVAQAEAQDDTSKGLVARFASRRGAYEDRRASAQAAHLGLGPAPAAESVAQPGSAYHGGNLLKAGDPETAIQPTEDSFDLDRAETARRLSILHKANAGTAWASAAPKPYGSEDGTSHGGGGSGGGGRGSDRAAAHGTAGGGGAEDDTSWSMRGAAEEAEVVPVGEDVGSGRGSMEREVVSREATGDDVGGGHGGEPCHTPRRGDRPMVPSRAVSRRQMTPEGQGQGQCEAEEGPGRTSGPDSSIRADSDQLASLPNMISPAAAVLGIRPCTDQGYSEASYLGQSTLQGPMEPRAHGHQNTRNSDLGYYLEESRHCSSPLRGVQPLRHSMLDSPMARQRAQQSAKDGEGAPKHVVLDYVPALRSQPSRSNILMAQPSMKQRHQPGDGDDDDTASRRLDYTPNKSLSRKPSHVSHVSGASLLSVAPPSRAMSPASSGHGPISPVGADARRSPIGLGGDSERCFHVTHAGAATTGLAAAAAAAASPLAATRTRNDAEAPVANSASQVHFGGVETLVVPAVQRPRGVPSPDLSRRVRVSPNPEHRASAPLPLTRSSSRLQNSQGGPGRQLHEMLGSAAWTGPSPGLSASGNIAGGEAPREGSTDGLLPGGAGGGAGGGSGSRVAGRAARLLASLQRLGVATPEQGADATRAARSAVGVSGALGSPRGMGGPLGSLRGMGGPLGSPRGGGAGIPRRPEGLVVVTSATR